MILILLAEIRDWYENSLRRSFATMVFITAAASALFTLQPLLLFIALSFGAIWLGWLIGARRADTLSEWGAIKEKGVGPSDMIFGKTMSAALAAIAHFLLLLPFFILTVLVWGFPLKYLFYCFLIWLFSCLAASSFALFIRSFLKSTDGYLGAIAIFVWLMPGFVVSALSVSNPIIRIWRLIKLGDEELLFYGFPIDAALIAVLLFGSIRFLGSKIWRAKNE